MSRVDTNASFSNKIEGSKRKPGLRKKGLTFKFKIQTVFLSTSWL